MEKFILCYITCSNKEEAHSLAKAVVNEKLAACANILPGMESVYWWKDKIEVDEEVVLILKTRESLYPDLEKKVLQLHSYECPCLVALPIIKGQPEYLKWLGGNTVS